MYDESKFHPFPALETAIDRHGESGPKRILIVTPDIVGPVSNVGIGTAYYYAANELARMGHTVSILYTLERISENKSIDHWIAEYGKRDVTLIPCPEPDVPVTSGIMAQAARVQYKAYEWLKKNADRFDVVHGSEWGANLYYCQLAKKLGLHFSRIHFVIKTSSPLLWNRIGNQEPIHNYGDLLRIFMERKSVEWADHVIGGSHYLLNWMEQNGYRMPEGKCLVQPNIFPLIPSAETKRDAPATATELVFFGRLERRKGLHLLLDALNRLLRSHANGEVDLEGVSVTFLGKPRSGYPAKKEIATLLDNSVLPYRIIDDFGQPEAIGYLKKGAGKLAIMPSVMDNSPFGVYELLGYKIPFITSTSGGGKELIHEEDHQRVLFEAHPHAIHRKLLELIKQPLYQPRPSFDMQHNLETWDTWHRALPRLEWSAPEPADAREKPAQPLVSICLTHYNRPAELDKALDSIKALTYRNFEIVIIDDGSDKPEALACLENLRGQDHGFPVRIYTQPNLYPGAARNLAARHAHGEYLLFMDDDNLAKPHELTMMINAIEYANADIITCFADTFRDGDDPRIGRTTCRCMVFIGADVTAGLFRNPYGDSNCLVRRNAFEKTGGFTEDYKIGQEDQEFFSRAILQGLKLYVLPEAVYWYRLSKTRIQHSHFTRHAGMQRVVRPFIEVPGLPVEYANILRYAQGLATVRLGVVANTVSRMSHSNRLRRIVHRYPAIYRLLRGVHRRLT